MVKAKPAQLGGHVRGQQAGFACQRNHFPTQVLSRAMRRATRILFQWNDVLGDKGACPLLQIEQFG
ncbi:hypothetical protein D9M71_786940 [compost metagenome]